MLTRFWFRPLKGARAFVAYLSRKMNDIRLKNKLNFSFVFVVFVPVLMVGLYLTAEFRQMTLDMPSSKRSRTWNG